MDGIRDARFRLANTSRLALVAVLAVVGGVGFAIAVSGVRQPSDTGALPPASATLDAAASEGGSRSPTLSATPMPSPTLSATPMPSPTPAPTALTGVPQPLLVFVGTEDYTTSDGDWTRYSLSIENWPDIPDELFEISTAYPCGLNPEASRTLVHIREAATQADIYGFCALARPEDLTQIWFAVPRGDDPPPSVQVVLIDQLTSALYSSTVLDLTGD